MTEAAHVFNQDVRDRSRIKSGATHKKNGSKSKKCTFPSDYLSAKEKKKLSGPVVKINMSQPFYDWIEFKKLPPTLQSEYICGLINNYGARACDLAEMFSIKSNTFNNYINRLEPRPRFQHGQRTMDSRFMDFVTTPIKPEPIIREPEVVDIPEKREDPVAIPEKREEPNPESRLELIKEGAANDAAYLHEFYTKCLELGFETFMAQSLTVERAKTKYLW